MIICITWRLCGLKGRESFIKRKGRGNGGIGTGEHSKCSMNEEMKGRLGRIGWIRICGARLGRPRWMGVRWNIRYFWGGGFGRHCDSVKKRFEGFNLPHVQRAGSLEIEVISVQRMITGKRTRVGMICEGRRLN